MTDTTVLEREERDRLKSVMFAQRYGAAGLEPKGRRTPAELARDRVLDAARRLGQAEATLRLMVLMQDYEFAASQQMRIAELTVEFNCRISEYQVALVRGM